MSLSTCAAALDWELMKNRMEAQDSLALHQETLVHARVGVGNQSNMVRL